jgi:hypothetical protein
MKLLLAAPVLLAVATSASAGNAWVLWSQETATRPDVLKEDEKAWHRMAGFDSKPACMSYASTKAGALARVLGASTPVLTRDTRSRSSVSAMTT